MVIYLLRHGRTRYNEENRYQGVTDVPLSRAGATALRRADLTPETVYVTPLLRTAQTAAILFPAARLVPVEGLSEMDFGAFEGRSYREMACDRNYRTWVDGGCTDGCPGGESREAFSRRVCAAFSALVDRAAGEETLVIVAHGGTQRAALEAYGRPAREYFNWNAPCGGGFLLSAENWRRDRTLTLRGEVCYSRD